MYNSIWKILLAITVAGSAAHAGTYDKANSDSRDSAVAQDPSDSSDEGGFIKVKSGGGGGGGSRSFGGGGGGGGSQRASQSGGYSPQRSAPSVREERTQRTESNYSARRSDSQMNDRLREDRPSRRQESQREESQRQDSRRQESQKESQRQESRNGRDSAPKTYKNGDFTTSVGTDSSGRKRVAVTNSQTGEQKTFGKDSRGRDQISKFDPKSNRETIETQHADGKGYSRSVVDKSTGRKTTESIRIGADGREHVTRSFQDSKGRPVVVRPNGSETVTLRNGQTRTTHPDGTQVFTSGSRSNGTYQKTIYTNGNRYTEQRTRNGYERTVVYNNRIYTSRSNLYNYGGYVYHPYIPFFWYPTPFYSYMYSPWAHPYYYSTWGYNPYTYYFSPLPYYSHPMYWLADFMIMEALVASRTESTQSTSGSAEPRGQAGCVTTTEKGGSWGSAEKSVIDCSARDNQVPEKVAVAPAKASPITQETRDQLKEQNVAVAKLHESKSAITPEFAIQNKMILIVKEEEGQDFKGNVLDASGTLTEANCDLGNGDLVKVFESKPEGFVVTVINSRGEGCVGGQKILMRADDVDDLLSLYSKTFEKGLTKAQNDKIGVNSGGQQSNTIPAGATDAPRVNDSDIGAATAADVKAPQDDQ